MNYLNVVFIAFALFFLNAGQVLIAQDNQDTEGHKNFKAGAATSNITPFLGGNVVGGFDAQESNYIHDELHARCLLLDDGATKLAFIVVDLIGMPGELIDEAKRLIQKEAGIPPDNVMISATHTHSATSAMGKNSTESSGSFSDYQAFLIRRFADVVKIALKNLEPALIGWGVGQVPEHVFVRRWLMKTDTTYINPFGEFEKVKTNPGYSMPPMNERAAKPDPDVSFITVQSTGGKHIALLANYSLHYVGNVPTGHISADYFAVFADRIQELLGADRQDPPFVGMMSNGTSGDVNNIDHRMPNENRPPYEKIRIVAEDVAREVLRDITKVEYHEWVKLKGVSEELVLKTRKPDKDMVKRAKWVMSRPDSVEPIHKREEVYARKTLDLVEKPDETKIILQAFRIGDLGVAAIPFETFAEIGLEIKEKSPFKTTFTIELANGSHGYLPTPKQHKLGGYETWLGTNRVEIEASEKIVESLLTLFDQINKN